MLQEGSQSWMEVIAVASGGAVGVERAERSGGLRWAGEWLEPGRGSFEARKRVV